MCAKVLLDVFEALIGELKFKWLLLWRVVIVIIKNKLNQNNNLRIYIGVVQCRMYCMVLKYLYLLFWIKSCCIITILGTATLASRDGISRKIA